MPTGDEAPPSRENILWEPATVVQYLRRDERYARVRERALAGAPTLSLQVYADVLAQLTLRPTAPDKLALSIEELDEFHLVAPDRAVAKAYATVYRSCLLSARNRNEPLGPWFVWNVALNHAYGCRILTNDLSRYAGIVRQDDLV